MISEECSLVEPNCSTVKRNGAASGTSAQTAYHRFMDTDFAYCRGRSTRGVCLPTILCDSKILIFMVWYLLTGGWCFSCFINPSDLLFLKPNLTSMILLCENTCHFGEILFFKTRVRRWYGWKNEVFGMFCIW